MCENLASKSQHDPSQVINTDGMFSLLYGLWEYVFRKEELRVLILGLDKAGKTTLLEKLKVHNEQKVNASVPPVSRTFRKGHRSPTQLEMNPPHSQRDPLN